MIVNDLSKEPFLLVRAHCFRQRDIVCNRAALGSDLGADRQPWSPELRPHRKTGRLGDATLPVQPEICEIGEGMWFVNGAFLGTLRLQLQNGREHGHHKNCWKAKTSRWAYGRCS